jgi:heme/copper-type cytochrome/quinol oxidase subunit 3
MSEISLEYRALPTGSIGALANGYWGMIGLIVTEAALFVYLEFSYYYYAVQPHAGRWPPVGPPSMRLSLPNTILLLASSLVVWWAERATKRGARFQQTGGLALAFLMGVAFVAIQGLEWEKQTFSLSSGPYGSLFFIVTGFHMAHVVVGLLMLAAVTLWSFGGYFGPARSAPVSITAIYWHFVDAVWVTVFFMFYVTPRLGLIWHAGST